MSVIRIVLLLLVVGGLAIVTLSNLSPSLPLVFLGIQTPALPLAVWVGGAIAAGVATSFCLQLLNYLQRGSEPRRVRVAAYESPPSRASWREAFPTPEPPEPEPQTRYTPPPPSSTTPPGRAVSDWEQKNSQDWDFDTESTRTVANAPGFDPNYARDTNEAEQTNYEVKQESKSASQTGSVYSYSYRDANESGTGKTEAVYDANYRVITPPYKMPVEPEENDDEEEDWGFEFDEEEEFDDDDPSQRGRRSV